MFERRHIAGSRRWVAIAAAYLLVLQAIVAGLASGTHAAAAHLDRPLTLALCAPGQMADATSPDPARPGHENAASCCVLGCAAPAGGAPVASAGFAPVIYRAADLVAFARHRDEPQGFVSRRSLANPRAPPAAA